MKSCLLISGMLYITKAIPVPNLCLKEVCSCSILPHCTIVLNNVAGMSQPVRYSDVATLEF